MEDGMHERVQIDDPGESKLTRRNFLKMGVGALSALAVLEVGGAGLLFLRARSQEGEFGEVITAGEVESFPNKSVTEFPAVHLYVIRAEDGGFLAVHSRCPHLGCTVTWVPEKSAFLCPCHASTFDFYGDFDSPPVPRPLDTFAVAIEEGLVMVDTSQMGRREGFTRDQLAYAG